MHRIRAPFAHHLRETAQQLRAIARKLVPDRWGLEECHSGSTAGGMIVEADCFVTATFKTHIGAIWWAWRHSDTHDHVVKLSQLDY